MKNNLLSALSFVALGLSFSCQVKNKPSSPEPISSDLSAKEYHMVVAESENFYSSLSIYLKADGSYEINKKAFDLSVNKTLNDNKVTPVLSEQLSGRYTLLSGEVTLLAPSFKSCPSRSAPEKIFIKKDGDKTIVSGDENFKSLLLVDSKDATVEAVTNVNYSLLSQTKAATRELSDVKDGGYRLTMFGCLDEDFSFEEKSSIEVSDVVFK